MAWVDKFLDLLGVPDASKIDGITFLKSVDQDTYRFIEGDRSVIISIERLSGNPSMVIYAGLVTFWQPPHEGERITDVDKKRIIGKVCACFDKRGWTYEIDGL